MTANNAEKKVGLNPCTHCGSSFTEEYITIFNGIGLKCIKCGVTVCCNKMIPQYAQRQEAIKYWNERTSDEQR